MESLNKNKKESNSKTLKWIFARTKRFLPIVALISFFSAIVSLGGVSLALLSKKVLEIATGDAKGSFWIYGIAIVAVVLLQVALAGVDTFLKAIASSSFSSSFSSFISRFIISINVFIIS